MNAALFKLYEGFMPSTSDETSDSSESTLDMLSEILDGFYIYATTAADGDEIFLVSHESDDVLIELMKRIDKKADITDNNDLVDDPRVKIFDRSFILDSDDVSKILIADDHRYFLCASIISDHISPQSYVVEEPLPPLSEEELAVAIPVYGRPPGDDTLGIIEGGEVNTATLHQARRFVEQLGRSRIGMTDWLNGINSTGAQHGETSFVPPALIRR